MKLTFLGTGTSIGSPAIGCQCEVCRSTDPRDKRLRTSAMIETDGAGDYPQSKGVRVLIDCGPDFRQQILTQPFGKIDAVLLTHIHYDHVAGIDDLRPFCNFGDVDIYAQQDVIDALHQTMPYCFTKTLYPGVPHLNLHEARIHETIKVERTEGMKIHFRPSGASKEGVLNTEGHDVLLPASDETLEITPIRVMHGKMKIMGYRIGKLAYITDMKTMPDEELPYLEGIDTLVINGLRFEKDHHSHQLIGDAVEFARKIGARKTYLVHVTHDIGFHDYANKRLPEGFEIPYDGQAIQIDN